MNAALRWRKPRLGRDGAPRRPFCGSIWACGAPGGRALPRQRVLACERRCVTLDEDSSVPTKPHISLIEPGESETAAPQILERLVHQAEPPNASDIHLHIHEGAASVAFRLDGGMTPGPG